MPIVGSHLAQSIAAIPVAERAAVRQAARRPGERAAVRRHAEDEVIVEPTAVEAAEATRNLAGNEQEESHQDRQQHAGYTADGKPATDEDTPRLDVRG